MGHDPYKNSAFSTKNKVYRQIWNIAYLLLFRPTPKILFWWRNVVLKIFGAKIGKSSCIHQSVKIWSPKNLICEDMVAIAENVDLYNPGGITIKSHAIISQGAYICGASHDYNDKNFPLFSKEVIISEYSWICARAIVMPGIKVKAGAILAIGSIATKDLSSWTIYAGSPAKAIKMRVQHEKIRQDSKQVGL